MNTLCYVYDPYTSVNTDDGNDSHEIPCFRIYELDTDHTVIAETNEDLSVEKQEFHARLFAASPDLLAALEAYVNYYQEGLTQSGSEIRQHALDAIASATR